MKMIKMVGIDHKRASLDKRELFSFTRMEAADTLEKWRHRYPNVGFVLITTCNRTELWLHDPSETNIRPIELLCRHHDVSEELEMVCIQREGTEAVEHLFYLACGMDSRIFGEDQIITQVKEAMALARSVHASDSTLEKLFQLAVTAAKKVKSTVKLTTKDTSVVEQAIEILKSCGNLQNKTCIVIGNGEMGRLTVRRLLEENCKVMMTLRQYKAGDMVIPFGCSVIPYEERYGFLSKADIVISATSSPHHTLHYNQTAPLLLDGKHRVLIDLAVPRDISSRLRELDSIMLYDIDTLGVVAVDHSKLEQIKNAELILHKYIEEFERGYYFKDWIPIIDNIGKNIAIDVIGRLTKTINTLPLAKTEQMELEQRIELSTLKSVTKLLYGLKNTVDKEKWDICLEALELSNETE